MATIAISASLQSACSSHHIKKQQHQTRPAHSLGLKQVTHVANLKVEGQNGFVIAEQQKKSVSGTEMSDDKSGNGLETECLTLKFIDKPWKKGTRDLNMFVNDDGMDWGGLIVAEAKRRKFLELYPEASTNDEPVLFRSSIIPWWAWLKRSYLPEAELLNGRAAMVGYFASYIVDALTGLQMVGQTGNFICKAGLLATVIGITLLRRTGDLENLRNLADEAAFYDKQWKASWQYQETASGGASDKKLNVVVKWLVICVLFL